MSIHISASKGSIAPTVLMPGDPLRAKIIAETFLTNPVLVSATRNIFYYTGTYKGQPISVGASGMGCPSMGIYSFELFSEYNVENIIRIGTCGAYTTDLKLFDLINVSLSASESTYALEGLGISGDHMLPQGKIFDCITQTAHALSQPLTHCAVHTSDYFYRHFTHLPAVAALHHCPAVEMESFALFANAQYLQKNAACLLTVSDVIPTHEKISADQREQALLPMMQLALETALVL